MSKKPTLLVEGSIVPNDTRDKRLAESLDRQVPIDYILDKITTMLNHSPFNAFADRVLVVKAETGSGKSTVMPAHIYKKFIQVGGTRSIACTQPRVLTAMDIPKNQIAPRYTYLKLGDNLGWATGPSKKQARYGLVYMTVGTLMQQMRTMSDADIMERYQFIIVDEVHEMSVDLAILIYMLKNMMRRNMTNTKLPMLILTSATFDHEMFLRYFGLVQTPPTLLPPNYIYVRGSSYKRTPHYDLVEHGVPDILDAMVNTMYKIHTENLDDVPSRADALGFLPGSKEMEEVTKKLTKLNSELASSGKPVFKVININREEINENTAAYIDTFVTADKQTVFIDDKPYTPLRKIILSTTVAETGLTIDTLKYVVDSGYHKGSEYNPHQDFSSLIVRPATQSRITQRKGRVGRKFDGDFYPLYPEFVYNTLPRENLSDVAIGDISEYILPILAEQCPLREVVEVKPGTPLDKELDRDFGYISIAGIDMVDMPPNDSLNAAWSKLYGLGFIKPRPDGDKWRWSITRLGVVAARFTHVPCEVLRMIMAGYFWEYSIADLVTIAAYAMFMNTGRIGATRAGPNWALVYRDGMPSHLYREVMEDNMYTIKTRLLLADDLLDGLVLMTAAMNVIAKAAPEMISESLETWCSARNVDGKAMLGILTLRDELFDQIITAGLDPFLYGEKSLVTAEEGDFINMLTLSKYCINDGYRLNLMEWNDSLNAYLSSKGAVVQVPTLFSDNAKTRATYEKYGISLTTRPKKLLYTKLTMKFDEMQKHHVINAVCVSALDGYIVPDPAFM